ncbi:MAG: polymer-forming cytoskeletal protein [Lachnospiraceae bacterium]|nr:polymer-forming cytoskeletal protein [Lachnospiraceae bacterium]
MSFFKELKEDIAQSVNELTESLEDGLSEETGQAVAGDDDGKKTESAKTVAEEPEPVMSEPEAVTAEKEAEDITPPADMDVLTEMDALDGIEEVPLDTVEDEMGAEEDIVPESAGIEEEIIAESEEEPVMSEELNVENAVVETEEDLTQEVTVITKGTTINGGIKSDTSLVVKGTIEGDVECQGKLTITGRVMGNTIASEIYVNTPRLEGDINSKGIVKIDVGTVVVGNVNCTSVVVAGAVKGNIEVNGPVVIDSTAVVKGDVNAKSIQMNSGAVIDGHCSLQFADVDVDSFFE